MGGQARSGPIPWTLQCRALLTLHTFPSAPACLCQVCLKIATLQQVVAVLDGLDAWQAEGLGGMDELRHAIAGLIGHTDVAHLGKQQPAVITLS